MIKNNCTSRTRKFLPLIVVLIACAFQLRIAFAQNEDGGIQPHPENNFYWQYQGKPILLLGGTWQDNLFNHPTRLEEHLDLLQSVGGNYVRNTMSHRNVGNVFAFAQNQEGLFDLNQFNDEFWNRFQTFLEICYRRDIIVQLEVWDPWDHFEDHQSLGGWSFNPFNPKNNVTYSPEESALTTVVDYPPQSKPTDHPFFKTVPSLANNELLLNYQKAFVDKLLSISLHYPNILYCVNNESGEEVAWSDYWADYVQQKAKIAGLSVQITEMRRREDVQADDHKRVFDDPERYTFVDISQNNAFSGLGQGHYDNIMFVRDYIADNPRPINNIKNYGANRHGEEESVARYCRMVFAGAASARFHRPHPLEDPKYHEASSDYGLGLSPKAQKIIQSMRQVTEKLELAKTNPSNDLLSERDENEAYLLAEEGKQYALYFPLEAGDGKVMLDLSGAKGKWKIEWINILENAWLGGIVEIEGNQKVWIQKPDKGHWAAVILPID